MGAIPGAKGAISAGIEKEAAGAAAEFVRETEESKLVPVFKSIPAKGIDRKQVLKYLKAFLSLDVPTSEGQLWAYVYEWGEEHHDEDIDQLGDISHADLLNRACIMFMHKNALNPIHFQSLKRMEMEVVSMACNLLNGDAECTGTMTTGGTESILMAVKAYRERAKDLHGITEPEMILSITAHPAFEKAAHYFHVKSVYVPCKSDMTADVEAMAKLINKNTIALVGSAPQYPHGVMDPIPEIAALGKKKGIPVHVDACVGGYLLPHVERCGVKISPWDFRVDGVTSISADTHKYGYAAKGASTILWKNDALRKYQFFSYANWPGGLFASPSALGTRSGAAIAAAWATLISMGMDGYKEKTQICLDTANSLRKGISSIKGLRVLGSPVATLTSFVSDDLNIFTVGDELEKRGWQMERQQNPDSLHIGAMPVHATVKDKFLKDLKESVKEVYDHPELQSKGSAALYGMVAKVPTDDLVEEYLNALFRNLFKATPK